MKQQIKESYDQIHAPIALINETKQLVHTTSKTNEVPKRNISHKKKWIPIAASLAACVCVFITGITVMKNPSKTKTPIEKNPVNVGANTITKGTQFSSIATADMWKSDLKELKAQEESTIQLKKDYILTEFPLAQDGVSYQVQIQIKQGRLVKQEAEYSLEGDYECVVIKGSNILGTTKLAITSSKLFTQDAIDISIQDKNQDGKQEFLLDTWYCMGTDYKVKTME